MAACYHEDIIFQDPVFGLLRRERAKAMWHMLLSNPNSNLVVEFSDVEADHRFGSASWRASYLYGKNRNQVVNNIKAEFEFKDGLIWKHTDHFDLYEWCSQALAPTGKWLGWSKFFQFSVQKGALKALTKYINKSKS